MARGEKGRVLELTFSAVQTLVSTATLGLAVWAIFFTTLPQTLEMQLRTEVVDAKEEAINIRRTNSALLDDQAALKSTNRDLQVAATQLGEQVRALEMQRTALDAAISRLRDERAMYAGETSGTVAAQIAAFATYELDTFVAIATICARYDEYREWLNGRRRLREIDAEIDSLPEDDRYDGYLRFAEEQERLLRNHLPDFLFGMPRPPNLEPSTSDEIVFNKFEVALLNGSTGDPEVAHSAVLDLLFSRIVSGPSVAPVTGIAFIEGVKDHSVMSRLLPTEREALATELDAFAASVPELASGALNVVSEGEPTADEIVALGKAVLPNVVEFRKAFLSYFAKYSRSSALEPSVPR